MAQSITQFIQGFGGGTRPNRFKISGNIGIYGAFTEFHINSADLPSAQVSPIGVNFRGRTVLYPGDRSYLPWSIIVLDENPNNKKGSNKTIYGAFHEWQEAINNHDSNQTTQLDPSRHFSSVWNVIQYDTNGQNIIRQFDLYNCWPVQVGPIKLDMTQDNSFCYFSVTMAYSHYKFTNKR